MCISCGRSSHREPRSFIIQRPTKPVPTAPWGTLAEVDAAGRFLVNWDTGKRTALNLEDDHFRIFQPELMELKLYFPLHGELL